MSYTYTDKVNNVVAHYFQLSMTLYLALTPAQQTGRQWRRNEFESWGEGTGPA